MEIYCRGCNQQFTLSKTDLSKINNNSLPKTFYVKLDNFRCIACLRKDPAYKEGNGKLLVEEREKMKLDVDTLTNNE